VKRINIVAWHNGGGLSRDVDILCKALRGAHYEVTLNGASPAEAPVRRQRIVHRAVNLAHLVVQRKKLSAAPYDINVFLEDISPGFFPYARVNAFIPNPEWFKKYQQAYLSGIDVVLCKTRSAQETFTLLGSHTRFVSFTSEDRRDPPGAGAQQVGFLHVAGRSWQKGTKPLFDAWLRHPEWPRLTVVQSAKTYSQSRVKPVAAPNIEHVLERLDDTSLRRLQNAIAIHLCPSEAEGFGHCIAEAMSCGALTLTTNAPPMNELITADRGILVNYRSMRKQRAGANYFVDPVDLERQIEVILGMDQPSIQRLGQRARAWYEENDRFFHTQLFAVLEESMAGITPQ
jgi:glycosyltransferase involved in cell wall biosynthesis